MKVLGVDPSCRSTGYGIVEQGEGGKLRALEFGAIPVSRKHSLAQTLSIVHSRITSLISEFLPDVVSMEAVFYAQNVRSAFKLGAVRGVVMLAAESSGVPVVEHSATEIKLAVTGFGRASKESVQKMVKIALRLRETPHPDDASDALAAAICHLNTEKLRAQVKASYEAQSAGRG